MPEFKFSLEKVQARQELFSLALIERLDFISEKLEEIAQTRATSPKEDQ